VQYIDLRRDYARGIAELLKILATGHQEAGGTTAGADISKKSPFLVPEPEVHGDAAEQVTPQEDHDPQDQARSGTRIESEALPASQPHASSMHSAPIEPQARRPVPVVAGHKDKDGDETVRTSWGKTKALVTAGAVLILTPTLYWGLRSLQRRPEPSTIAVVQPAPTPAPVPIGPASGPQSGAGPVSEVNPAKPEPADGKQAPQTPPIKSNTSDGKPETNHNPAKFPDSGKAKTTSVRPAADAAAPSDPSLAKLYRQAEAGDSSAMVALSMDYVFGQGVSKDYPKAATWLRKAANAGNAKGMNNLGVLYANGYGVSKDYQQAAAWYRRAAEAGYVPAMANLGSMYEKGNGMPRDSQQAMSWYRRAAQAGNTSAMYDLGAMFENGEGVLKDRQQAVAWYRRAAGLGEPHAKEALSRLGATL
jgi:Sel1 repeat